jgi:oligopeptide/dipeptide ABC transporter ATP-binding protein
MTLLSIENLEIVYKTGRGELRAVEDVSFSVEKGRNFGLVGESGCGKSTLLKAVMGVLPPNARVAGGRIVFEGRDLTRLPEDEMRPLRWKRLAMITQSALNALDPVFRVGDQIVEAIQVHEAVRAPLARSRVERLFEMVGIDPSRFAAYPHQFSGGMRQRAVIAMSLALEPAVVIADEPTTSLDVIVQDQIFTKIRQLQDRLGFSLLLVTHDVSLVVENCDDIGVMYAGKLMECGPVPAVLKTPCHPYTMGLKNSFPNIRSRRSELISIPGVPPALTGELPGCRFASRCPFAAGRCREETPRLAEAGPGRRAACHFTGQADEMRRRAAEAETWRGRPAGRRRSKEGDPDHGRENDPGQ